MTRRPLPVGVRAWWNDPKAPSTDQPFSKWGGEPVSHLRRTIPRKPVTRGYDPRRVIPGAFEGVFRALPILPGSEMNRGRTRQVIEEEIRFAIVRPARRFKLDDTKPGGLDRIRGPKINPRLPGLVPEALSLMVRLKPRGTQGAAVLARGDAMAALAAKAQASELQTAKRRLPIGRGYEVPTW